MQAKRADRVRPFHFEMMQAEQADRIRPVHFEITQARRSNGLRPFHFVMMQAHRTDCVKANVQTELRLSDCGVVSQRAYRTQGTKRHSAITHLCLHFPSRKYLCELTYTPKPFRHRLSLTSDCGGDFLHHLATPCLIVSSHVPRKRSPIDET